VNRRRYEGYVAVRDAIAAEPIDDREADLLADLAEGLLLARGPAEATAARDRVPAVLALLVERGHLSRVGAHRLWAQIRTCGPALQWPPSWQGGGRSRSPRPPLLDS
jgi:hypothetical protein